MLQVRWWRSAPDAHHSDYFFPRLGISPSLAVFPVSHSGPVQPFSSSQHEPRSSPHYLLAIGEGRFQETLTCPLAWSYLFPEVRRNPPRIPQLGSPHSPSPLRCGVHSFMMVAFSRLPVCPGSLETLTPFSFPIPRLWVDSVTVLFPNELKFILLSFPLVCDYSSAYFPLLLILPKLLLVFFLSPSPNRVTPQQMMVESLLRLFVFPSLRLLFFLT